MKSEMMKMLILRSLFVVTLMLIVSGCSLFEYHPYETNVRGEKNLNAKAIREIQSQQTDDDTIRLILMGDSQRFYDELDDFVRSANKQRADFVFLNGDITDFGVKDEYEWIHDIMQKLKMPYVAVIGNHDLSGNGETLFKKIYGPLNNAFVVKRHKFILLNTNSREYHFNGLVPDIGWLQDQLNSDGTFDHASVVSHIAPYDSDFDPALEDDFVAAVQGSGVVRLNLHAHQHKFSDVVPYDDGIRYLTSTSMDERMYLLITLVNGEYQYSKVFY
jgi:3',5'-cyclic AMP phosphodiesterase CpdA